MKKIKNIVIDSGREILQILFLIFCFIIPPIVDLSKKISVILGNENPTIETAKYYYLMLSGNWMIGILIVLYVLFYRFRVSNKKEILNRGNIYHNKPYWWYWFCSKILGYQKCNLVLVPIYTQFKLILRDTFNEYPFNEYMFPEEVCKIQVDKNFDMNDIDNINDKTFNLIIQDTYSIHNEQIPESIILNKTVNIKRDCDVIGKRIYCKELIENVVAEIRKLPEDTTLNIFATTNPKNTYEIVKKGISLAERGNITHVNVFQQKGYGKREFEDKPNKIF